jgi:hypothetical protein
VADPATVVISMWIMVRPVHQAAEVIPLVHTMEPNPVTHPDGHSLGNIDIVSDQ